MFLGVGEAVEFRIISVNFERPCVYSTGPQCCLSIFLVNLNRLATHRNPSRNIKVKNCFFGGAKSDEKSSVGNVHFSIQYCTKYSVRFLGGKLKVQAFHENNYVGTLRFSG